MGLVIIVLVISAYAIGTRYIEDPMLVALIILSSAVVLLIVAFVITDSFERLAQANRLKSEFVSIVSHQLRTPLSNLKWTLELLMSGRIGKIEGKQLEYFSIIKENSERMSELVKDLLIVSRIETAKLHLKKIRFSLERIAEESVKEYSPLARASNVEIEFSSEKGLPEILADPSQIRLVIENLLDNAVRYTKGRGVVRVRVGKRGKNIYFEIRDEGIGIPREDQKYIFQKFFRANNVLKYQTQGTGLGLYIVKSIVERSGGSIGFLSQEGKGSTFWFTLPIR